MTDEQKLKVKTYDLWWIDKQRHIKDELIRVINKHGLEKELIDFGKELTDYVELAQAKLGINITPLKKSNLSNKTKEEKPKKENKKAIPQATKIQSIGLDFEI